MRHKIRTVKDKAATSIAETLPDQRLIQDRAINNSAVESMELARDLNCDLNFCSGPSFRPEIGRGVQFLDDFGLSGPDWRLRIQSGFR